MKHLVRLQALTIPLLFLLTACAAPGGSVICRTELAEDAVVETVQLSDGELVFEKAWASGLTETLPLDCATEIITFSHDEFVEYLGGFDPLSLDNLSPRCTPTEGKLTRKLLQRISKDYQVKRNYTLKAGTIWGGVGFRGGGLIEESTDGQHRKYDVVFNKGDAYNYLAVSRGQLAHEANSMVGEIPVYVSHKYAVPALEGWVGTHEYYACFFIAGYSCGIYMDGYSQQEFVDMLLAIINYYGAYPSQATP